ncbi:uncharacterized protein EV420DRAFT_1485650 [Desarmillaria tabescens]|uniref:Uncharacterized protein n=1 Tax=Armillaria tabescens TaxID=1929756 RepID=A0AA39JF70_ARMTA|nr:uncharacterized protein EV420DRAFT_1485650 [Desarmillaria tabescens]KAK0441488.1 hypothetical protein EV420DRAFT_1485650 [Desarmillaria tabescens]
MTDGVKPLQPQQSSNATSSSSLSTPPPPHTQDVEHGVSETSPLYHRNLTDFVAPQKITSISIVFSTIVIFTICTIVLTLFLHGLYEKKKHQLIREGLVWTNLSPSSQCLRYNTQEYAAELAGVPIDGNMRQWCEEKQITIHGIEFKTPAYCTIDVDKSAATVRVYGHWAVDSDETSCKTLWEDFRDKGCVFKGFRCIEARMGNYQLPWDNWREMCFMTLADYDGHHFDHLDSCEFGIFTLAWGVCPKMRRTMEMLSDDKVAAIGKEVIAKLARIPNK